VSGKRGKVLVVDDSAESTETLTALVEREGFGVVACDRPEAALAVFERERPVAVLLDCDLPDGRGIEVCRAIRVRDAAVPILFVNGSDDEASAAGGLDAGADDYLHQPVRAGELIARLEAHLRKLAALRAGLAGADGTMTAQSLEFGDLTVDLGAHDALIGGEPAKLGPLEFRLLEYLARNSGVAVSRDQILNQVYGEDGGTSADRVDTLVRRLRAKVGDDDGRLIAVVPGFGYRFDRRTG
jgi:DNA-binding response OmpR family regulator